MNKQWQKGLQVKAYCDRYLPSVWVRGLAFVCGLYHVIGIMWDPYHYSERLGGFTPINSLLLIWGICSSMIFAVGFIPRFWLWRWLFSPYFSLPIVVFFMVRLTILTN